VRLPFVLSIPHGGTRTPQELADRVVADAQAIFEDGDAFTAEIYDLDGAVAHVQRAEIARAFVDLHRHPGDRPPRNPDGVVKSATCFAKPLYAAPLEEALIERLLARYHQPYHQSLAEAARAGGARLGLDCHSMLPTPPPIAPEPHLPRPLFCLSNGQGRSADATLLARLADCIAEAFDCPRDQVLLNRPFRGGYITLRHGGHPLPWVQVEMNRSLYLTPPWFDSATRSVDPARLADLRGRFETALRKLTTG